MSTRHPRTHRDTNNAALTPPTHAPFAIYGTPLPPYDADARHDGSYVPLWKQEVRDEHGRKRLHGAFTGGWSAGYFNTVGSKEGWTPATFTSSRKDRAKDRNHGNTASQRPEDFMDDEDLADQAEKQTLQVHDAFASVGATAESNGANSVLAEYFATTTQSMGSKLLQQMGWKQGQGIGGRVKRRAREDLGGASHMFAPQDAPTISFKRKSDRRGVGFAFEATLVDEADTADDRVGEHDSHIWQRSHDHLLKRSLPVKKTGIGVGVLNDDDSEDDEAAYDLGPKITYNRVIGAKKRKRPGSMVVGNANVPRVGSGPRYIGQMSNVSIQKCNDGRRPIAGFVLSRQPIQARHNLYPPRCVPTGWHPKRLEPNSDKHGQTFISTADAAKASALDAKSRAALLGEQQLPGKSVFDFLSAAARERLVAASGNTSLPQALGEKLPVDKDTAAATQARTLWGLVPELSKETALAAVQRSTTGWMPYSEDEAKRARYRYFVELKAGLQSALPERPSEWTLDDWSKELREFAQAAEVFRPVSHLMASRFTSSSSSPQLASDAFAQSDDTSMVGDEAEKAAKLGMFGPLTRSTHPFDPPRLLCKRFAVRPPTADVYDAHPQEDAQTSVESQVAIFNAQTIKSSAASMPSMTDANVAIPGDGGAGLSNISGSMPSRIDSERNQALEGEKAGEAVFKAIFGSDDDSD